MTKIQKKNIIELVSGIGGLIAFYLWYSNFLGLYSLLVVVFTPIIITFILVNLIPTKNSQKRPRTSTKIKKPTQKFRSSHNLLRSDKEIITLPLEKLSSREFERLCYLYYKAKGNKPEETPEGADGGVDLIIYNSRHEKVAIQIKHKQESGKQVGVQPIRELDSAKKNYGCVLAEFISSTGYSNVALVEADKRHIDCHTADKIVQWKRTEAKKEN